VKPLASCNADGETWSIISTNGTPLCAPVYRLADQTSLVSATAEAEARAAKLRDMASQGVLLNQKHIRLDAAIAGASSARNI
jgi:hypothetical protein